jgi:hypothetical protein
MGILNVKRDGTVGSKRNDVQEGIFRTNISDTPKNGNAKRTFI